MKKIEEIENITTLKHDEFDFTEQFHDFVGNRKFGLGYERPDGDEHYIWDVLSAVGNSIGNVIYSNVTHYSDLVSNIDTCKIKQLQSFLELFGMNLNLMKNQDQIPVEILNLIDTLSINKKYLFKNDIISDQLKYCIDNYKGIITQSHKDKDWYYKNIENSFYISKHSNELSSSISTDCNDIYGEYKLVYEKWYKSTDDNDEERDEVKELSVGCFIPMRVYENDSNIKLIKLVYCLSDEVNSMLNNLEQYVLSSEDKFLGTLGLASEIEDHVNINNQQYNFSLGDLNLSCEKDEEFINVNQNAQFFLNYIESDKLSVDTNQYNYEAYYNFTKQIFFDTLSHFISLPYNSKISADIPIAQYDDFWNEYHKDDTIYITGKLKNKNELTDIDQYKLANNISWTFDEQQIVDDIENNRDSFENYSYKERTVLSMELENRKSMFYAQNNSYEPYTRYSYYREQKVWNYVNFIEQYLYSDDSQIKNDQYKLDTSYFIKKQANNKKQIFSKNDNNELVIDQKIISDSAEQLANIVQYICKLREKLKLQVRKNYMKGTQNLLRYVVNEYIQDFATNCKYFKEDYYLTNKVPELTTIYKNLVNHKLGDVEVIEYKDFTEYYNIQTDTTDKSLTKDIYNEDYFTEYFGVDKATGVIKNIKSPLELDVDEIRSFYLSTLLLDQFLTSDKNYELNSFLCSLYRLGKSRRYLDSDLSIMVCDLTDGRNSLDMYNLWVDSSTCYSKLTGYLNLSDEYEFKEQVISDQFDDIVSSYLEPFLSVKYLSDYATYYNEHIDDVDEKKQKIKALSDDYIYFISQKYPYYYTKSNIKYCYENNDVNGEYKHDYLYENSDYESPYIYENLRNLEDFSNDDNLKNYSLIDTTEYFKNGFSEIYDDYTNNIVNYLESKGYIGTEEDNFKETLDAALSEAKDEKKTSESDRDEIWNELKEQVAKLLSDYKSCEEKFQSIYDTYSSPSDKELDDITTNIIYLVSSQQSKIQGSLEKKTIIVKDDVNEIETEITFEKDDLMSANRRSDGYTISGNHKFLIKRKFPGDGVLYSYYNENGWIGAYSFDIGKYQIFRYDISLNDMGIGTLTRPNMDSAILYDKLSFLSSWLIMPRTCVLEKDDNDDDKYLITIPEIKDENVYTAYASSLTQTKNCFKTLEELNTNSSLTGYSDIVTKLSKYSSSYVDPQDRDIKVNIETLNTFLNSNDSSDLKDYIDNENNLTQIITKLTDHIKTYSSLQSEWKAVKQKSLIQHYYGSNDPGTYINNTTILNLENLPSQKDPDNIKAINESIEDFKTRYDDLEADIRQFGYDIAQDLYKSYDTTLYIEEQVDYIYQMLEDDKNTKYENGMLSIDTDRKEFNSLADHIEEITLDYNTSTDPVTEILQTIINDNYIYGNDEYNKALQEFNAYSNTENGYQKYYNYKNYTHATRQVHPFMWNFIKYINDDLSIKKVFSSYSISELEDTKAAQNIDKIIGNNGNPINLWKYSIQDFSGYTTRYISNRNVTEQNTTIFEVAEYDGAFYPPAIEQYREDYQKCIHSLSNESEIGDICRTIRLSNLISSDLSSYPLSNLNSELCSIVYDYFDEYVIDNNIEEVINDFVQTIPLITLSDEITNQEYQITTAKAKDFYSYIEENQNKTFYERFYSNLELTKDNILFIAEQLNDEEIRNRIFEITNNNTKANAYDIYNYCLDRDNNMYILYKQYEQTHPTYKQKKNTAGQIWVRLKNHPIAFPLIHENKNKKDLSQIYDYKETNKYLHSVVYESKISRNYCYEMMLSYDKTMMALVCTKTDKEFNFEKDDGSVDEIFKNKYEYATIVTSFIDRVMIENKNIYKINLTNRNGTCDDIIKGYDEEVFNSKTLKKRIKFQNTTDYIYSFIGMYSPSGSKINFVYSGKKFELESEDSNRVHVYIDKELPQIAVQFFDVDTQGLDSKNSKNKVAVDKNFRGQLISKENRCLFTDVVFAYNKEDGVTTFCFLKNMWNHRLDTGEPKDTSKRIYSGKDIDIIDSTDGAILKDKFQNEMNSYDVFIQNVCTLRTNITKGGITKIDYHENNINSDMSYIPLYPNKYEAQVIPEGMKENKFYNIELLGKSKNIDKYIDDTNPDPNPNFTIDDLKENKRFGRVYEDYLTKLSNGFTAGENEDKSYVVFENPSINSNIYEYCTSDRNHTNVSKYQWTINLENYTKKQFSDKQIEDTKIVIFNKNNLGKNPYYFGNLTTLINPTNAYYTTYIDELDIDSNDRNVDYDNKREGHNYTIIGQVPVDGTCTSIEDNTIYNISDIKFSFDKEKRELTTTFEKQNEFIDSGIKQDTIRYVLFNTKDINVFKFYHLIDQYGIINVYYGGLTGKVAEKIKQGGYSVIYDTSNYSQEELEAAFNGYYLENGTRKFLSNIELSDYTCLSDVYIFSSYDKLAFKYSDEDIFELSSVNYYFPILNTKYPYTVGQLLYKQLGNLDKRSGVDDTINIYDIYNKDNVFILNLAETKDIINDIGSVDIKKVYKYDDCVIAFEDYLDEEFGARKDFYDARVLQHLKFNTLETNTLNLSKQGGIELSELGIESKNRTTVDVLNDLEKLNNGNNEMFILSSEHGDNDSDEYMRVKIDSTTSNIDGLENLYITYKRNKDLTGLTLYFNYNNYLNSPYIKFDDDYNVLIDTLDNTYLKLESGESGYLDIVLQVKYEEDKQLIGYTNLILMKLQIFNISDDKPKFVVRVVSKIQKDQYTNTENTKSCTIGVEDIALTQDQLVNYQNKKLQTDINIQILPGHDVIVTSTSFLLFFPSEIFDYDQSRSPSGCSVENYGNGCLKIETTNKQELISIPVITISNASELLLNNTDIYEMFIEDCHAYEDETELYVNIQNGKFMVSDAQGEVYYLLQKEQNNTEGSQINVLTNPTTNTPILTRRTR